MKKLEVSRIYFVSAFLMLTSSILLQQPVQASPFGQGVFGADVPFGSLTSLAISLGGNVGINLTLSGGVLSGTGSHTLTVTSNDVIGYRLYTLSPSGSSMTSGSDTIPASSNSTEAALSTNTWGYNTSGSTTNFIGMQTTPTLIKDAVGPFKNGDNTTVTYGARTDVTKAAGSYTVGVVYTVVAKNP